VSLNLFLAVSLYPRKIKGSKIGLVVSLYPSSILALSPVRVCDFKVAYSQFYSFTPILCPCAFV